MSALPSLTTPTADLKLSFTADPSSGSVIVDLVYTPSNDLALVTGINRLEQDIVRWLLTPVGSNPLDPDYGNPLFTEVGRPGSLNSTVFNDMMSQAQDEFLIRQQAASAAGFLSLDEQVDSFTDLQVFKGGTLDSNGNLVPHGFVAISFVIHTRSGLLSQPVVPFSLSVAA